MNCHNQVLRNDPRLAPVRESAATGQPIPWVQVHIVPDYVFFNDSVHVARGIGCVECHGRVDQMDEVRHAKPFSMSFCSIAIANRRRSSVRWTRSRIWAGDGAPTRTSPRKCKEPMASDLFTTGVWNRSKTAEPVTDDEFTIYDLRFTIEACQQVSGELFSIGNGQSAIGKIISCSRMKPDSTTPNPATTGRRYWRSLDELGDTPEFKQWLEREFPQGASEFTDPGVAAAFCQNHVRVVRARGPGRDGRGLPPGRGKTGAVWPAAGRLCLWRTENYAMAMPTRTGRFRSSPNPTKAGPSSWRATQNSPAATAAPTATPGFHPQPLRSRPSQKVHESRRNRFPRRSAEISG